MQTDRFDLFTRFQNPAKKILMEVMGEEVINGERVLLVAELDRLFELGYDGIKIKEKELIDKLRKGEIQIVSKPIVK